jgi:hypothetical protein
MSTHCCNQYVREQGAAARHRRVTTTLRNNIEANNIEANNIEANNIEANNIEANNILRFKFRVREMNGDKYSCRGSSSYATNGEYEVSIFKPAAISSSTEWIGTISGYHTGSRISVKPGSIATATLNAKPI